MVSGGCFEGMNSSNVVVSKYVTPHTANFSVISYSIFLLFTFQIPCTFSKILSFETLVTGNHSISFQFIIKLWFVLVCELLSEEGNPKLLGEEEACTPKAPWHLVM